MSTMVHNVSTPQLVSTQVRDNGSIPWRIEFNDSRYTSVAAHRLDAAGWSAMMSVGRSGVIVVACTLISIISCIFLALGVNLLPTTTVIIIAAIVAGVMTNRMSRLWILHATIEHALPIPPSQERETRTIADSLWVVSQYGSDDLREVLDNEVWRTLRKGDSDDIAQLRKNLSLISSEPSLIVDMPICTSQEIVDRLHL